MRTKREALYAAIENYAELCKLITRMQPVRTP